jgi:hypothetical protein
MSEPTVNFDKLYFTKLMQAVYDMRMAQQKYFQQRGDHNKKVAIAKEIMVDNMLVEIKKAGYIVEPKKQDTSIGKLF